jgi:hypothetical protein
LEAVTERPSNDRSATVFNRTLLLVGEEKMVPSASQTFQFEQEFVGSLRCIPMAVRLKLDTCGIKLKLDQWNRFDLGDRQYLLALPCETGAEIAAFRSALVELIRDRTQTDPHELPVDPAPGWLDASTIPSELLEKIMAMGVSLSLEQWETLTPLQRFALIKLGQPSHESHNFLPALREFELLGSDSP